MYSYGVILGEIATRQIPWDELDCASFPELIEELTRALQSGRRPHIPDEIGVDRPYYVGLMRRCWAGDPADRPTFSDVVETLQTIVVQESAPPVNGTRRRPRDPSSSSSSDYATLSQPLL